MTGIVRTNSWLGVTSEDPWTESFDGTGGDILCVLIDQVWLAGGGIAGQSGGLAA